MTLPRYRAICDHWERAPPLGVSTWIIAQSLGAKKAAPKARTEAEKTESLQGLFEMMGAGGSGFSAEKPEWLRTTK